MGILPLVRFLRFFFLVRFLGNFTFGSIFGKSYPCPEPTQNFPRESLRRGEFNPWPEFEGPFDFSMYKILELENRNRGRVVQNNFGVTQFEEINKHADQIEAIWSILNVETQTQVSRFPILYHFFTKK